MYDLLVRVDSRYPMAATESTMNQIVISSLETVHDGVPSLCWSKNWGDGAAVLRS